MIVFSFFFTFHDVSINTVVILSAVIRILFFTFHDVSINTIRTIERSTKRKFGNRFKTVSCKFDILLGSREMDCYEINDIESVKKLLNQTEDEYDYIFIDFPPQNSLVTMMYLVASDYLIAPLHLAKESSLFAYNDIID